MQKTHSSNSNQGSKQLKWRLGGSVALLGFVAAWTPMAFAAEPSAQPAAETGKLADVVVTAQRRTQNVQDVPISVAALSSGDLTKAGPVDSTTLTQLSPSLSFRAGYSPNSSSFAIRGVTSIAVEGGIQASTALVIDGVPTYRQGEFVSDLGDIESIEILRGPQGTLFGKNSSAGVVNITMAKPAADFGGSVQVGATNDEEYWINGMINIPLSDGLKVRLTAWDRDQSPLIENKNPAGNDLLGAKSYGFTGKISADLSPSLNLLLSAGYWNRETTYGQAFAIGDPFGGLFAAVTGCKPARGNDCINSDANTKEYTDESWLTAEFNWDLNEAWSFNSTTGYREYFSDTANDIDGTQFGGRPGGPILPTSTYPIYSVDYGFPRAPDTTKYWSQEFRLHYAGERADFVSGVFYQNVDLNAGTATTLVGPLLPGSATQFYNRAATKYQIDNESGAIFGDLTYKLGSGFTAFGGLRYTHETLDVNYHRDDDFIPTTFVNPVTYRPLAASVPSTNFVVGRSENNTSGRVGLQWQPTDTQNYYISWNRGYKGPAADTSRAATNTNPLKPALIGPEIAEAFEIGTKQRLLDDRLEVNLSVYDQKVEGIQQTATIPGTISTALTNAGDLKSRGAELETQFQATDALLLKAGVSYTDAKYSGSGSIGCWNAGVGAVPANCVLALDGQQAINAPEWRFNVAADYLYHAAFGTVDFNAAYSWTDDTQFSVNQNPTTIEPGYGLLNASITAKTNNGFEVQLFGRNLTDETFYSVLSSAVPVGKPFGYFSRDYKAYGGVSVKYNF